MADVCDDAAEHIEAEMSARLARASIKAAQRELVPTGFCQNPACDLPLDDQVLELPNGERKVNRPLFCCLSCSKAFEMARSNSGRGR